MPRFNINVLGEDLAFTTDETGANEERIAAAKEFVEDAYMGLKNRGGQSHRYSRNALLALLILGIADDLLQLHDKLEAMNEKIEGLLGKIDTDK